MMKAEETKAEETKAEITNKAAIRNHHFFGNPLK
jgi:hypothetical protein